MKPRTLADRLREVMNEKRPPITQEALADRVGVTPAAVSGWLKRAIPYPKTLNRICWELGIKRSWLLWGEPPKYLPKDRILEEMPQTYSRREKITFIEEYAPELLPTVDAFLDSLRKQLADGDAARPEKKTHQSSRSAEQPDRPKRAAR